MELIRTLKEKRQANKQIKHQRQFIQASEDYIRLSDFDNDMYIAYNDLPLVPIDRNWTVPQILEKLNEVRQNYVNAKMKEDGLPKLAAILK